MDGRFRPSQREQQQSSMLHTHDGALPLRTRATLSTEPYGQYRTSGIGSSTAGHAPYSPAHRNLSLDLLETPSYGAASSSSPNLQAASAHPHLSFIASPLRTGSPLASPSTSTFSPFEASAHHQSLSAASYANSLSHRSSQTFAQPPSSSAAQDRLFNRLSRSGSSQYLQQQQQQQQQQAAHQQHQTSVRPLSLSGTQSLHTSASRPAPVRSKTGGPLNIFPTSFLDLPSHLPDPDMGTLASPASSGPIDAPEGYGPPKRAFTAAPALWSDGPSSRASSPAGENIWSSSRDSPLFGDLRSGGVRNSISSDSGIWKNAAPAGPAAAHGTRLRGPPARANTLAAQTNIDAHELNHRKASESDYDSILNENLEAAVAVTLEPEELEQLHESPTSSTGEHTAQFIPPQQGLRQNHLLRGLRAPQRATTLDPTVHLPKGQHYLPEGGRFSGLSPVADTSRSGTLDSVADEDGPAFGRSEIEDRFNAGPAWSASAAAAARQTGQDHGSYGAVSRQHAMASSLRRSSPPHAGQGHQNIGQAGYTSPAMPTGGFGVPPGPSGQYSQMPQQQSNNASYLAWQNGGSQRTVPAQDGRTPYSSTTEGRASPSAIDSLSHSMAASHLGGGNAALPAAPSRGGPHSGGGYAGVPSHPMRGSGRPQAHGRGAAAVPPLHYSHGTGAPSSQPGNSSSHRSALLEEFRSRRAAAGILPSGQAHRAPVGTDTTAGWTLDDIRGHVVEFCMDQHGSRFAQDRLDHANRDEVDWVFREIMPSARVLMEDVFGNYVVQKLYEYGQDQQRLALTEEIRGHVVPLSLSTYGCRVIQKALDYIPDALRLALADELRGHILKLAQDQNANHVVQKLLSSVESPDSVRFVSDAFRGQVAMLGASQYSCRVLQRIFERCGEGQARPLLEEMHASLNRLMIDQYGNYVVQWILQMGHPSDKARVIQAITGYVLYLSSHKFASNVVEQAVRAADPQQRFNLASEILEPLDSLTLPHSYSSGGRTHPAFPAQQLQRHQQLLPGDTNLTPANLMMTDQYANYVLQRFLELCEDAQKRRLVAILQPRLAALRSGAGGPGGWTKHLAAVERLVNEAVAGRHADYGYGYAHPGNSAAMTVAV